MDIAIPLGRDSNGDGRDRLLFAHQKINMSLSDYWLCACGAYSPPERTVCATCGRVKHVALTSETKPIPLYQGRPPGHFRHWEQWLQYQIAALLSIRGIRYQQMRMDVPSTGIPGWPDFVFVFKGHACAWECKIPPHSLEPDQERVRDGLIRDGWKYTVIVTVEQAHAELREMEEAK